MSPSVIQTDALTKIFRDFWRRTAIPAVTSLDMRVPTGSIFGLLGPNGSGKSTTLKLLLGLLHPTQGTVSVLGTSPRRPRVRDRIGYLPEEAQLYRHLTAAETLHFYGSLFGLRRDTLRTRTEQLLDMTGLAHAATRPIGTFSKGMHRRIGLAQALINDPDVLILDEPTAGLDPMGCRQTKTLLRALAARGKTVLLSSHLMADVEDVCDHIMVLHHGTCLATGPIADLLECRDRLRFCINAPPPQQLNALKTAIRDVCGTCPTIDTPRLPLETFFMQTIANATETNPVSGVAPTTRLAPFLEHA